MFGEHNVIQPAGVNFPHLNKVHGSFEGKEVDSLNERDPNFKMPMSPQNVNDYTADQFIHQKKDAYFSEAQKWDEADKHKKTRVQLEREKQQKAASE